MEAAAARGASNATSQEAGWPVAGLFLDALSRRDFAALRACLEPDVRLRLLGPGGPDEVCGAIPTVERFRAWFGAYDVFEIVDATIGRLGPCMYLRWRVRRGSMTEPDSCETVEQHAFAGGAARIDSLDLLSSGFHAD